MGTGGGPGGSGQRHGRSRALDRSEQQSLPPLVRHSAVNPKTRSSARTSRRTAMSVALRCSSSRTRARSSRSTSRPVSRDTTSPTPRRTQLCTVERGISSSGNRSGSPAETICSLMRWSGSCATGGSCRGQSTLGSVSVAARADGEKRVVSRVQLRLVGSRMFGRPPLARVSSRRRARARRATRLRTPRTRVSTDSRPFAGRHVARARCWRWNARARPASRPRVQPS